MSSSISSLDTDIPGRGFPFTLAWLFGLEGWDAATVTLEDPSHH